MLCEEQTGPVAFSDSTALSQLGTDVPSPLIRARPKSIILTAMLLLSWSGGLSRQCAGVTSEWITLRHGAGGNAPESYSCSVSRRWRDKGDQSQNWLSSTYL